MSVIRELRQASGQLAGERARTALAEIHAAYGRDGYVPVDFPLAAAVAS